MFTLKLTHCEEKKTSNGRTYYRLWFLDPNGQLAWVNSSKKYEPGDDVTLTVCSLQSTESYNNMRLVAKIG